MLKSLFCIRIQRPSQLALQMKQGRRVLARAALGGWFEGRQMADQSRKPTSSWLRLGC